MKQIEPGCLAVVLKDLCYPGQAGKEVRVASRIHTGDKVFSALTGTFLGVAEMPGWLVTGNIKGMLEHGCAAYRDGELIRIDGGDDQAMSIRRDEEIHA